MADNNLSGSEPGPDVSTPAPAQTYEEHVEDISKLLEDPATDLPEGEEDNAEAAPVENPEDDPLGLDAAEDVGEASAGEPEGSEAEIKGGRFAPDSAKVTLDDGSVITVADLKRNNLYQRDYTRKTTELAAEREQISARKSEVDQQAQSLDQLREYAAWYAQTYLPQPPAPFEGDPTSDPVGYMKWTQSRDRWNEHAQAFQQFQAFQAGEQQRRTDETARQRADRDRQEADALIKAMPVLKDPQRREQAWNALVSGAQQHYGVPAEEVNSFQSHKYLLILRDALAYRRIKDKAPQVQEKVAARPAMRPGQRMPTQAAPSKERQVLSERLSKSGSIDDAVALLSSLKI